MKTYLVAALLALGLGVGSADAAVTLSFAGTMNAKSSYGPEASSVAAALGGDLGSPWSAVIVLPDILGPYFAAESVSIDFAGQHYASAGSMYVDEDIIVFASGVAHPVDEIPGEEGLFFNMTFVFDHGALAKYRGTPPTDAEFYDAHLLAESFAEIGLVSFPGTPYGESGARFQSYPSGFPTPALTSFSADGAFTEASVPEPAAWVYLIAGFFGVGTALRFRRRLVSHTRQPVRGFAPDIRMG